ncbi:fructose-1,6-bisphosphatase/inositol monophosphatase family enzyme [Nakamurella sp. UYEF19]|uniref:inositol monophosphatase family protein n=1 Tax=Nakamurella sp. UYEF19 TaxID=1756392 RepID=UPI0033997B4B
MTGSATPRDRPVELVGRSTGSSACTTLPDAAQQLAIDLACEAARSIDTVRATAVTTKAHPADLVTELDTRIELDVRDRLLGAFPDHRLIGEEFGAGGNERAAFTWYCDPVDGTTNYANDLGWSAFSLCCTDADGPLLGVVTHPVRRELVLARRGGGAWRWRLDDDYRLTGEPARLAASSTATLAGTVFTTELLAHLPWPGMFPMIDELAARSCTARILGSSALTLLQVAAGRAAGAVISTFSPIDNLASILAGLEAGAVCLDSDGHATTGPAAGGVLLAAPQVAEELSAIWRNALAD